MKIAFSDRDIKYIEKHLECAKPVAKALDLLQGENNTFYGIVLPCLLSLKIKLQYLPSKEWSHCKPLAEAFANAVEERFKDFFNFSTPVARRAAMAALSYPRFRKKWFACVPIHYQELFLKCFQKEVEQEILNEFGADHETTVLSNSIVEDEFFAYGPPSTIFSDVNLQSRSQLQIFNFFADNREELSMLHEYPAVKKVFTIIQLVPHY